MKYTLPLIAIVVLLTIACGLLAYIAAHVGTQHDLDTTRKNTDFTQMIKKAAASNYVGVPPPSLGFFKAEWTFTRDNRIYFRGSFRLNYERYKFSGEMCEMNTGWQCVDYREESRALER